MHRGGCRREAAGDGWLAEERLTHQIIGACYRVYNELRFGFLEHVYAAALERELLRLGLRVGRQLWVHICYDGSELCQQRLDFVVNEGVVVELKATGEFHRGANRQLLSDLRATDLEIGLLLHFGPEPKFYRMHAPNTCKSDHKDSGQSA